jgi:CheY-like chemotaxis protein
MFEDSMTHTIDQNIQTAQKRIIIAEDNSVLSDVMRFNLEKAGFHVTLACNGQQAMELLAHSEFDLLITDYQMPGVNGAGLCHGVRDELGLRNLPILMCSAKGLELDTNELQSRWQVTQVLFKPFSMREIVSQAQKLTTGSTAESAHLYQPD